MDRIVCIGAGNVACHLASALHESGYEISQVFSRTEQSARSLAEQVGGSHTTDPAAIDPTADVYLYAVTDSVLPELAARIVAPDALHLHTSGSTGMDVFARRTRHYGVLYPLQTFSKSKPVCLPETNFFIEGNDDFARGKVRELASALSHHVQELDSTGRRRLHLAAVFACNFANHLWTIAGDVLQEAGLPFDVMLPLIRTTVDKLNRLTPAESQTGPAMRRDSKIMQSHIDMLDDGKKLIYTILSDDIMKRHEQD